MSLTADQLYSLLPAIHRIRDAEQGGVLRQLVSILAQQAIAVEEDIDRLYGNWFIETCEEWAVPYLGDLLGVRGIHAIEGAGFSQRARVANTLQYRQRKGTAKMLQQLAEDASGWRSEVVEFFNLIGATQHLNHIRPHHFQTPDLRDANRLERLGTAFDSIAHTVDVRDIESGRGRYNIPNIGIFVWRLQNYRIARSPAAPAPEAGDTTYRFDPIGRLAPLAGTTGNLSRRLLYQDVEAIRQARADNRPYTSRYFSQEPVFEIWLDGKAVDPGEIAICDLGTPPNLPPAQKIYSGNPFHIAVGVDPQLGRLAIPAGAPKAAISVSYSYSFSGDVGAGPYDRRSDLATWLGSGRAVDWQLGVSKTAVSVPSATSIAEALLAWKTFAAAHPGVSGLIVIMDSESYRETLTGGQRVEIPANTSLTIAAAGWAKGIAGQYDPVGLRPALIGDLEIFGGAGDGGSSLTLDGLLVNGNVTVSGGLGMLNIGHSTLVPGPNPAAIHAERLHVRRSLCGAIAFTGTELKLEDTVAGKVDAALCSATIESCTVFGTVRVRDLQASNTIFTAGVTSTRRQTGCVRFCYVPPQSGTPRRYRCQPDLALKAEPDPNRTAAAQIRLAPVFTSDRFGDAAYAQLSMNCAPEIQTGADDRSEMGVFHYLQQAQREINLRSSLAEYLRFGLEAGISFVS